MKRAPVKRAPKPAMPTRLVILGVCLDLHIEREGVRRRIGWRSRHWLCSDLSKRRLFVVPVFAKRNKRAPAKRGGALYELWNGFDPHHDFTGTVKLGTREYRGRCLAVGYRSDKWGRTPTDYQHDFDEPPRVTQMGDVYCIAGRAVRVTPRGITG